MHKILSTEPLFARTLICSTSRTTDEMYAMFAITAEELANKERVLLLPGGACGWGVGKNQLYIDPLYEDRDSVSDNAQQAFRIWEKTARNVEGYFAHSENLEPLISARHKSLLDFLEEYKSHPSSYLNDTLPKLTYTKARLNGEKARLILSSYLIFFYPLPFTPLEAIRAMLEVGSELRIHPLITKHLTLHPDVHDIQTTLEREGYSVSIVPTKYTIVNGEHSHLTMIIKG